MRKVFITPDVQVVTFEEMDIITTSGDFEKDPYEVEGMGIFTE